MNQIRMPSNSDSVRNVEMIRPESNSHSSSSKQSTPSSDKDDESEGFSDAVQKHK